jgi:hypothetical protein
VCELFFGVERLDFGGSNSLNKMCLQRAVFNPLSNVEGDGAARPLALLPAAQRASAYAR